MVLGQSVNCMMVCCWVKPISEKMLSSDIHSDMKEKALLVPS